jgi:hypothetical protein
MIRHVLTLLAAASLLATAGAADEKSDGWISLWDGKTFEGWKPSEHTESWKIEDGAIVCQGERSHLFYVGEDKPFKNFELSVECMTTPGSNAGIYFHTKFQEVGWPKYGQEVQVNVSQSDPKRSGSLYGVVSVGHPPLKDNEWYTTYVKVEGKHVLIKLNDTVVVDYIEPNGAQPHSADFDRILGEGTFALQAHDPGSKVYFRNLKVKRLP